MSRGIRIYGYRYDIEALNRQQEQTQLAAQKQLQEELQKNLIKDTHKQLQEESQTYTSHTPTQNNNQNPPAAPMQLVSDSQIAQLALKDDLIRQAENTESSEIINWMHDEIQIKISGEAPGN